MDYQRINCFLKAAETLNFSEAARQFYITPQAFGKQIHLLEQELGFALFERNTRQIRLTPAGKKCYDSFKVPFCAMKKAYDEMLEQGRQINRRIRIGVFNALSRKKVVSPIVAKLLSSFPNQDISINMRDMGQMQKELQEGRFDLGIMCTHDRESGWENCVKLILKESPCKVVVSKNHRWVEQENISVEDLENESYTRMDPSQFTTNDYFGIIPCKTQLIVDNYETLCMNIDQGCFAIMPYAFDALSEQDYKSFDMPCHSFLFRLAAVYNKDYIDTNIENICKFLKKEFETIVL